MAQGRYKELSVDAAKEVIAAQAARLNMIASGWRLAFTQHAGSLVKSYDTLVIGLPDASPLSESRHIIATVPAVVHEVLLVLQALSGCRGFSFRDNIAFWIGVLPPFFASSHKRFEIQKPSRSFPRVVLYCNHERLDGFQRKVFDLFFPGRLGELTEPTRTQLRSLHQYRTGMPVEPIECAVRLNVPTKGNDTRDLLAYVTQQLHDIDQAREGSTVQLTGLELVGGLVWADASIGLKAFQLKPLQLLCANLPQSISLALRFHHSQESTLLKTPVQVAGLASFVRRTCGFQGSEFAGRLAVLDLIQAFSNSRQSKVLELGSVCSLLPSTRSLREVRLSITAKTDWLWLAYAIFHPQSRQSSWRALALSVNWTLASSVATWQDVDQLVQAGATSTAVMNILDREEPRINGNGGGAQARRMARRTATTLKRTTVYRADRVRTLVTLARGETVEVCDTTTNVAAFAEGGSESTVVFIPGYWFGYASRSCLSATTESEELEPLTSCITRLAVFGMDDYTYVPQESELGILRLFGPSLKHLRVREPNWFQQRGFSQYVPLLESIDYCEFWPNTQCNDFLALPKLRSLSISCGDVLVEKCFRDLLVPCRGKLHELRLSLTMSPSSVSTVKAFLEQCLGRLLHLELLVEVTLYQYGDFPTVYLVDEEYPAVDLGDITTNSDLDRSKRAFLSAVHFAQTRTDEEFAALAQLDSSVLRLVFEFCGLRLESLVVRDNVHRRHERRTLHETDTEGDAWH